MPTNVSVGGKVSTATTRSEKYGAAIGEDQQEPDAAPAPILAGHLTPS